VLFDTGFACSASWGKCGRLRRKWGTAAGGGGPRSCTGGRSTGFDGDRYRRRNEVERTINRLKNFRAVPTRYDEYRHRSSCPPMAQAPTCWTGPEVHRQFTFAERPLKIPGQG
jgi:transposase